MVSDADRAGPKKVAGLTQISNEAASDSNPAVADQIGRGLARSVAKKIDAAFFAKHRDNGPSGLLSLSGINVIDTGTVTLTSLDPFHEAKAALSPMALSCRCSCWPPTSL